MRVLVAWELGDNYGHILRQLPIVKMLRARGHEVLFVAKDVAIAQQILGLERIRFLQAPVSRRKKPLEREIASYADILVYQGFGELDCLRSLVCTWQHIYSLFRPDVVVIDHAPTALFAAQLTDICTIGLGTGFEFPPLTTPFPCFRPWLKLKQSDLLATEKNIVENINIVRGEHSQMPIQELSHLMKKDAPLLATFSELDHYYRRKNGRYLGSLFTTDQGVEVAWPDGDARNIFVYLRPGNTLKSVLQALSKIDANVLCAIPGISADLKARYETDRFRIYPSYLKIEPLFKHCDIAITHAGHGTVAACMLAGVPMLVLPTHIEQMLMAACVARLGIGLRLPLDSNSEMLNDAIRRILSDSVFFDRVRVFSEKYQDYDQSEVVERIVNTIERLPGYVMEKKHRPTAEHINDVRAVFIKNLEIDADTTINSD